MSILSAIFKEDIITLSRKEIITANKSGNRKRLNDNSVVKKKRTTCNDYLEFVEQFLTTIDTVGMSYRYLVLDNVSIHKTNLVHDWVEQRGYHLVFLPPYSLFLNPIESYRGFFVQAKKCHEQ